MKPSAEDVRAVHRVLYERDRRRELKTEINSITVLMNFDPGEAIGHDDPRVQPGAGPLWFIPNTGAVDPAVLEAADRCERVARILGKIQRELGELDIDRTDRGHLRDALGHQISAWQARARLWRAPGSPNEQVSAAIARHETASVRELKRVDEYLKGWD